MGKTLFIVRHGHAKQTEVGGKDYDRQLSAEGLQQSSRLGAYIYKKNTNISAIVCSAATRAVQTAEKIADQLNYDIAKIQQDGELYEASVRIFLNKVCEFSNDWNEVVIVGHNPVVSYFVEYLTGYHFDGMETGSMVKIHCDDDDWKLVSQDSASFQYFVTLEDYNAESR